MPSLEDVRLGQLAVAKGLCQPLEVEECLALQHKNEQAGNPEQLGELLIVRGYLTRTQLARLLTLQREAEQKVTRIGPYELIKKLGEGGMGAVYEAKDTRSGETVALKVLPRSRARDKAFMQRFEQEARAAFELDHPNIIHGRDFNFADGYHFLVMDYVQGKDVYSLLEQKGRLTESEALAIIAQIASALDHIHGERLVHRDIKPENIMVTDTGVAKLADMGLAIDNETQGRRRITQAGIAMGTPFYLSPEQIEGKAEPDIRADIYALGATAYEMITGRPPFDGETPAVVMMKHLNEQVPSPHDIDRGISINFCHVLEKMMAKDPALRYQSPAELLEDINRVRKGEAPVGTRPGASKSSVSRPSMHTEKSSVGSEQAGGDEPLASSSTKDSPDDSRGGGIRSRLARAQAQSALNGTRNRPSGLTYESQNLKMAVFVGLAVAVAVLVFMLISLFGPKA